jgi:hypothetical protein
MPPKPHRKPEESEPSKLLRSISESLTLRSRDVLCVEGQHITRHGNLVYPVRIRGRKVFVTVPDRDSD